MLYRKQEEVAILCQTKRNKFLSGGGQIAWRMLICACGCSELSIEPILIHNYNSEMSGDILFRYRYFKGPLSRIWDVSWIYKLVGKYDQTSFIRTAWYSLHVRIEKHADY